VYIHFAIVLSDSVYLSEVHFIVLVHADQPHVIYRSHVIFVIESL
jgi:hypothetical protein